MARKRKKVLQVGDRFQTYISAAAKEELIDFINKQTDLSSTVLYGFLVLHAKYGNRDITEFIPRTFNPDSFEEDFINKFLGGSVNSNHNVQSLVTKVKQDVSTKHENKKPVETIDDAELTNEVKQPPADEVVSEKNDTTTKDIVNIEKSKTSLNEMNVQPSPMSNLFQISGALSHGNNKNTQE